MSNEFTGIGFIGTLLVLIYYWEVTGYITL